MLQQLQGWAGAGLLPFVGYYRPRRSWAHVGLTAARAVDTADLRQKSIPQPQPAKRLRICAGEEGRARHGGNAVVPGRCLQISEAATVPGCLRSFLWSPESLALAARSSCAPEMDRR